MTQTVLILDDSLTVRMDLAEAFEAAGFAPVPCATVAELRLALAGVAVDVFVLDVNLPDGDGVDLLRELRGGAGPADAVIIMLSTEAEVSDRIRGLSRGADEYVGKPYDSTQVVARARDLLRSRGAGDDAPAQRVLVIDDSVTYREALRDALGEAGYDVSVAGSGEEGLRAAAARRPTAMVVDGVLPGMDGASVIRSVRLDAALRGITCVLLTGSEGGEAELRALQAGADAFVRKEEDLEVILARLAAAMRTAAAAHPDAGASLLGPKRILAVDDSATYLGALGDALRVEGYDVVLARSGEEALELLAVQGVDCILLDLIMPGLGGEATCRRIRDSPTFRDVPLIILTGRDDRTAMIDCLGAGADDYISKSSELEVVKARVRAQLRRKQVEDETRRMRERLLRTEIEAAEARAAKQLAETRAALVAELEDKNAELEAFSYSVSHDLRAPLRSIIGFSSVLAEEHGGELGAEGARYLERVRSAAHRMNELIDDLLQLSRVGRADLQRAQVDVTDLAARVVAELRHADPHRSVDVVIQPAMSADADARLLRVVLENLLGNAWKFTAKTPDARIVVRADVIDGVTVFQVRDNGAGFDMAFASKLFHPFQRLHSERDFAGTGIGLATIRRIIERHGGRVWAEGIVGAGATIRFTLPPRT